MNSNVEKVQQAFDAFAQGDVGVLRSLLHPDAVWHEPGRSPLAGTYRGAEAVLGHLAAVLELTAGSGAATLLECGEISPGTVAALVQYTAEQPHPVDQRGMQLIGLRTGRIVEVRNFAEDQYAQDAALTTETNEERTRRGYRLFAEGDVEGIRALLHPDITWTVSGRNALSGTYRGIDEVVGYFVALFERSGGTFRADLLACGEIAPDLVHCQVRLTGDLPGGRLDSTIVQTFRTRDGRTIEVHDYAQDRYALDEAFGTGAITLPDARQPEQATTPAAT